MKVIILAGGYGTRLGEYTDTIPKPLVEVAGKPIIWHIMKHYMKYGLNDFVIALGYKGQKIKEYFLNYEALNSDLEIDMLKGVVGMRNGDLEKWKVQLIDTGIDTPTGGRLKRLENIIGAEAFMLTYGDGVSDVNLNLLYQFHQSHGRLVTMTAVRPPARFGELSIEGGLVTSFEEKPQMHDGWINGGFFVMEPGFLKYIKNEEEMLERGPLSLATSQKQLMAFQHDGFWQCMDNRRDKDTLDALLSQKTDVT